MVPFGHLHICPLQWNLSRFWNQFEDPQSTEVPVLEDSKLQMVAGPGSFCWHSSNIHQLFPSPFHGCMSYGMGSTPGGRRATRKMGASGTTAPHQSTGNVSGGQNPSGILLSPGHHSPGVLGQLHSLLLHTQGGRNRLPFPQKGDRCHLVLAGREGMR